MTGVRGAIVSGILVLVIGIAPHAAPRTTAPVVTAVVAISCPSELVCVASASVGPHAAAASLQTTDGGSSWSSTLLPFAVSSLSCPTTSVCVGVGPGDHALTTTDGGTSWVAHTVSAITEGETVSCPRTTACWMTGLASDAVHIRVLRSTDEGATWSVSRTPPLTIPMSNVSGISCASVSACVVTANGSLATIDAGARWLRGGGRRAVTLDAVDCTQAPSCVAVSNVTSAIPTNESAAILVSRSFGNAWVTRLTPSHVEDLDAVSCPTSTRCLAVGSGYTVRGASRYTFWGAVESTRAAATTWVQHRVTSVSYFTGVSCVRGTLTCMAVGVWSGLGAIARTTDAGATWRRVPTLI